LPENPAARAQGIVDALLFFLGAQRFCWDKLYLVSPAVFWTFCPEIRTVGPAVKGIGSLPTFLFLVLRMGKLPILQLQQCRQPPVEIPFGR
jgi:hypothetical protein